jgi:hypothetical protein
MFFVSAYHRNVKFLFKWLVRFAFLAIVLLLLALVFKDSVLRVIAENRIRQKTGMDVSIGKFSSGIFSPVVTIQDLKLYNTAEFGGAPFLNIAELHIECDTVALAKHRLHITLARLNLAEFDIVRNEAGKTNIFFIKDKASGKGANVSSALGNFKFDGIDVLNLSIGKEKFIDLKEPKNNREVRVDLQNQIFKNVTNNADLLGIAAIIYLRSGGSITLGGKDFAVQTNGKPAAAK